VRVHLTKAVEPLVVETILLVEAWQRFYFDATKRRLVRIGEASVLSGRDGGRPPARYPQLEAHARQLLRKYGARGLAGRCERDNAKQRYQLTDGKPLTEKATREYLQNADILPPKRKRT
jgi:hypothetical protein